MYILHPEKEAELFDALDVQGKLFESEKRLEESERQFNAKIYELEQEKVRVVAEHERFKCQNAEEIQRLGT